MASSGSTDSANAVKPLRSQDSTATRRRWLGSDDSPPDDTIRSATSGESRRFNRLVGPVLQPVSKFATEDLDYWCR
jgi:hypothetical protein